MTKTPTAVKMCIKLQWISLAVYGNMVLPGAKSPQIQARGAMIMKNEKALGAFMAKIAEAQTLLAELQARMR